MVRIIIFLFFLISFIYNYSLIRKNILNVRKNPLIIFILVSFSILLVYICFKYDNRISGYTILLLALLTIMSFAFGPGIGEEGFNIFLGTSPILKACKFNQVKKIDFREKNKDYFEIVISVYNGKYIQAYRNADRKVLEKIIERYYIK